MIFPHSPSISLVVQFWLEGYDAKANFLLSADAARLQENNGNEPMPYDVHM